MNKGTNLPPKITADLDIIIPPNFEMFAKEDAQSEQVQLNLPPRIGENNPLCLPCLPSSIINFENSQMGKLNLDSLLNPHQNDLEFMEQELNNYRKQVQAQTEEFKQMEREKNELKNSSHIGDSGNIKGSYDYMRTQNTMKQKELDQIQAEKNRILAALTQRNNQSFYNNSQMGFAPPPAPVVVNSQPKPANFGYDNFFETPEVVRVNNNNNDFSDYYFYEDNQPKQNQMPPTQTYGVPQNFQPQVMRPAPQASYIQQAPPQQIGMAQNPLSYGNNWANQSNGNSYW
jgi:hypothetical protein